jgi:hypothetical protein
MKNVDCEIYIKQVISFFENNPNDLMDLIGEVQRDEFYDKIREKCEKNVDEDIDYVLTRQQMIEIVLELKVPELHEKLNPKLEVEGFVQKTKWGEIILN